MVDSEGPVEQRQAYIQCVALLLRGKRDVKWAWSEEIDSVGCVASEGEKEDA